MNGNLCFLQEDGEARTAVIFVPLLDMLFPAFVEAAEEVCVNYSRVTSGYISATYIKNGKSFPLDVEANFSPADVFARLKIISGISIAAEGIQTGETHMRFKGSTFKVSIEINVRKTQETIWLRILR